jgi:signal transduction histidine kinase
MDFEMNVDLGGEFGELAKTVDRMRTEIKSRISSQNVLVSRALAAVASERSKAEELGRTNAQLTDEITARESAQQRLKEAFAATKQMEEQLRQTMERAEAANRSKSEFLANMSHELRTPLNHIIGFTELIADKNCGDINPVQEEYLNDVLRAGRHLLSLINDVLDLSKIEAGKMEVDAADVPIRDLLSNSLSMIKEKALKHGIRLSLNIASAPDYVMGDERKLKQVMYNLLSNAAKFTPDGGHIEVGSMIHNGHDCGKRCDDGKSLAVWVRDTGIGIEPQDIERIFAPFEQVESSISRKFHGTGLGLSLTRKIVELHGGRIHAKSEGKGRGTVFEFTLPIDRAHWATS